MQPKSLCVHCFKPLDKPTKDHVFPSAWYTDNTPNTVQRWTVPSCKECNERFGRLEKELFIRLSLCIDHLKAEASGINRKLLRTLGIGENISEKELRIRQKKKEQILNETLPYQGEKTFPGLGLHEGYPPDMQRIILVPDVQLSSVLEKIFRGAEYILGDRYIMPPLKLNIYHVDTEPEQVTRLFQSFASFKSLGPGFSLQRVVPTEGKVTVLYKTVIWGTLVSYASILGED